MEKEQINDIIGWDIVNWSKSFDFWNQHIDVRDKGYQCLELGARQGGLSLWLALNNNKVICSDVSYTDQQHELDKTIALHKKHQCEKSPSCFFGHHNSNFSFFSSFSRSRWVSVI